MEQQTPDGFIWTCNHCGWYSTHRCAEVVPDAQSQQERIEETRMTFEAIEHGFQKLSGLIETLIVQGNARDSQRPPQTLSSMPTKSVLRSELIEYMKEEEPEKS